MDEFNGTEFRQFYGINNNELSDGISIKILMGSRVSHTTTNSPISSKNTPAATKRLVFGQSVIIVTEVTFCFQMDASVFMILAFDHFSLQLKIN